MLFSRQPSLRKGNALFRNHYILRYPGMQSRPVYDRRSNALETGDPDWDGMPPVQREKILALMGKMMERGICAVLRARGRPARMEAQELQGSRNSLSDLFSDEKTYLLLVLIGDPDELESHAGFEIRLIALSVRINDLGSGGYHLSGQLEP